MTAELFGDLAKEFADIDSSALKSISLREHYAFVDMPQQQATALISSLNGIEYNGFPLPVELAIVPESRSPRDNRRPRGGRSDDRRSGDRRHDRRGRNDRRSHSSRNQRSRDRS
jgi:hypothetical protein